MTDDDLIGLTIRAIRKATPAEKEKEYWHESFTIIEFNDGTKIYASRDSEGNGAGVIFGLTPHGRQFGL